jgi:hypothetical protein
MINFLGFTRPRGEVRAAKSEMTCPQPEDRHATMEREALIALWRHLARN